MNEIAKEKIWTLRDCGEVPGEFLAAVEREHGLGAICARLLYCRGCRTPEAVRQFLCFEDVLFHSPFLLRDVDLAVARIRRAVESGEKIVIYGDYDVDGVTSIGLLYLYLKRLGADVEYYIPSRSGEGYGLSCAAIGRLAEKGVTCIVTVDTGVTACEEADYAASLGVDMVITDHHECRQTLPAAVAVVNPHRPDCPYPFKDLAGVGVVFKLLCAFECTLGAERGESEIDGVRRVAAAYADLVAIGTIADVMPLTDENRLIVALGLRQIENTRRVGLAALLDEAMGGKKRRITSSYIGFGLAPRINAAGRMSDASLAVDLLLAETPERAAELAVRLCEINSERQVEENRIAEQAYRRIEREFDPHTTRVLVLEDNGWRQGIVGIVSSRITERYGLPSILISFDTAAGGVESPDDLGKGSGRSVRGMNMVEALSACEDLLVKFGGHELAAGLTIRRDRLDEFRERINAYAMERLPEGGVAAGLEADLELTLPEVTLQLAGEIGRLEPFGVANPEPTFVLRDLVVERVSELGGGKHLKVQVGRDGLSIPALLFSTARSQFPFREGDRVDLLGTLQVNEFRDVQSVQMVVKDFKASERFCSEYEQIEKRYRAVKAGGTFTPEEDFIPDRQDFAHVYGVLRREFRMGNDIFPERMLLTMVNVGAPRPINYVRLKYILEIFHELRICGVEEIETGVYRFDIFFNASKANIEKSSILKNLKSRCHAEA